MARRIGVPVAGLLALSLLVIGLLLLFAAREQNRVAIETYAQLGQSALHSQERQIARVVRDYTVWDEAFTNLHEGFSQDWAVVNMGDDLASVFGIDRALVFSPQGALVYGFAADGAALPATRSHLHPSMRRLLADAAAATGRGEAPAGVVLLGSDPYIASAHAIVPSHGEYQLSDGPSVVLFARRLGGPLLTSLSAEYLLPSLSLDRSQPEGRGIVSIPLTAMDGSPAGWMSWSPELPGMALVQQLAAPLAGAFGMMFLLLAVILVRSRRAGHDLDEAARQLAAARDRLEEIVEQRTRALQSEIVERRRVQEQLVFEATHDGLTGLPNRTLFMQRLDATLRDARLHKQTFGVLFIDGDRFKLINDSLGHQAGDQLLVDMGRRFRAAVRSDDMVARLGGDEFAVLLHPVWTADDATLAAQRVVEAMARPFCLDGREVHVGVSIGVALGPGSYADSGAILRDADIAMYRAKQDAGQSVVFFQHDMHAEAVTRLSLEADLRTALNGGGGLRLVYQPIVSLKGEDPPVTCVEALLRWNHPELGPLSPNDFLTVAEETGMMAELGAFVLGEACRQLGAWRTAMPELFGRLRVSVNASVSDVSQPDFTEKVAAVLLSHGVLPEAIQLEITEEALMRDPEAAQERLEILRALGIAIALDDFGSGYSSLAQVHRMPLDVLKIDRGFVAALQAGTKPQEMVKAIVALAHALDLKVVAEGIETVEQQALLAGLGCGYGQGYLFARPLEAADLPAFLEQSSRMRHAAG